jgi:hypothetical protein
MAKKAFCEVGTDVQTLLFPRDRFNTANAAKIWAREHGFKAPKVDTTDQYFRLRQESPESFIRRTFRTIEFGDSGIKAVVGCPSPTVRPTRFEKSLAETATARAKVPRKLLPLFDHLGRLALDSHERGNYLQAGRELRKARELAKKR